MFSACPKGKKFIVNIYVIYSIPYMAIEVS